MCVPSAATEIEVPTVHALGTNNAIVHSHTADCPGVDTESASADITNAYSFVFQQRLDWWLQGFIWVGGVRNSLRAVFGGAFAPQGFTAVMAVPDAKIAQRISAIELEQPPPPHALAVTERRRTLQLRGLLPAGAAQLRTWSLDWYLDDALLNALNDHISTPEWLLGVETGHETTTRSNGGRPSAEGSRILVYLKVIIKTLTELGFEISISKTQSGDIVITIGFRINNNTERIDVPPAKRATMLESTQEIHSHVLAGTPLERKPLERLVGRLSNISQVEPALLAWLHAGYAVASARTRRRHHLPKHVTLRQGGRRQLELCSLLDLAASLLEANEGIPTAHSAFPATSSAGVLTTLTDASLAPENGDDGVGGFAFHADAPGTVYLFSVPWPPDVRAALLNGCATAAERTSAPATAMPLAETFGSVSLATLVAARCHTTTVVAVGDCDPSAAAITAGSSDSAQVRELLRYARQLTHRWAGVSIPREWHTDADLLSHPSNYESMVALARSLFRTVVLLPTTGPLIDELWQALRAAIALPMATVERAANCRADRLRVAKVGQLPPSFTSVHVRRPGPLGNPFYITRCGRLDEDWRAPLCAAYRAVLAAAITGQETSLLDIALAHGLPPTALQQPYASRTWQAYSGDLLLALCDLDRRVSAGEMLALTCSCHPRECHADAILDALTSQLCLPCSQ